MYSIYHKHQNKWVRLEGGNWYFVDDKEHAFVFKSRDDAVACQRTIKQTTNDEDLKKKQRLIIINRGIFCHASSGFNR